MQETRFQWVEGLHLTPLGSGRVLQNFPVGHGAELRESELWGPHYSDRSALCILYLASGVIARSVCISPNHGKIRDESCLLSKSDNDAKADVIPLGIPQ
jgi:hypothetical protein